MLAKWRNGAFNVSHQPPVEISPESGGRLVLIEYKGEDPSIPILPSHKMTVAQAKLELESDGFTLTSADSSLPRQHVLTFTVKGPDPFSTF